MDPSEIDWERQERGMAVLEAGIQLFGDERYGGAWFDQTGVLPILHVSVVDPSQDEIDVLERAAHERRWHLTVTPVRYSYQELVNFTELVQDMPANDSMAAVSPSPRDNVIEFTLRRLDQTVMDHVLERLPRDAVKFVIQPGLSFTTIEGSLPPGRDQRQRIVGSRSALRFRAERVPLSSCAFRSPDARSMLAPSTIPRCPCC